MIDGKVGSPWVDIEESLRKVVMSNGFIMHHQTLVDCAPLKFPETSFRSNYRDLLMKGLVEKLSLFSALGPTHLRKDRSLQGKILRC